MKKKNFKSVALVFSVVIMFLAAYVAFAKPAANSSSEQYLPGKTKAEQAAPKYLYVITFPNMDKGKTAVSVVIDSIYGDHSIYTWDKTTKDVTKTDFAGKVRSKHKLSKMDEMSFDNLVESKVNRGSTISALDNFPAGGISSACADLISIVKNRWGQNTLTTGCAAAICLYADCSALKGKDKCDGYRETACASCAKELDCVMGREIVKIKVYARADVPRVINGN